MDDLPYFSSEQGVSLQYVHAELIYEYTIYVSYTYKYKNFDELGWAYNTSGAYNTCYTVYTRVIQQTVVAWL